MGWWWQLHVICMRFRCSRLQIHLFSVINNFSAQSNLYQKKLINSFYENKLTLSSTSTKKTRHCRSGVPELASKDRLLPGSWLRAWRQLQREHWEGAEGMVGGRGGRKTIRPRKAAHAGLFLPAVSPQSLFTAKTTFFKSSFFLPWDLLLQSKELLYF